MSNRTVVSTRIIQILARLYRGERLNAHLLADEFHVSFRTLQRDFKALHFLEWKECQKGFYQLDCQKAGILTEEDIQRFANLTGTKQLFPHLEKDVWQKQLGKSCQIKGTPCEETAHLTKEFKDIQQAICAYKKITFYYCKHHQKQGKFYKVSPYGLINKNGIWYMIAIDNGKEKTFCFTQITKLTLLDETFIVDKTLQAQINNNESLSFGNQLPEVIIHVSPFATPYFLRRTILPNQQILEKQGDGGLLIKCENVNALDIIPTVQYWIPHLRIVKPSELQGQIMTTLQQYIRS